MSVKQCVFWGIFGGIIIASLIMFVSDALSHGWNNATISCAVDPNCDPSDESTWENKHTGWYNDVQGHDPDVRHFHQGGNYRSCEIASGTRINASSEAEATAIARSYFHKCGISPTGSGQDFDNQWYAVIGSDRDSSVESPPLPRPEPPITPDETTTTPTTTIPTQSSTTVITRDQSRSTSDTTPATVERVKNTPIESTGRCEGILNVTIELQQGRNYLHLPFDVCDIDTVGDIYSLLQPTHLFYYDDGERVRATADSGYKLAPHQGFQVWMQEAQTLELLGTPYPEDIEIEIVEGWQYFGFPRMVTGIETTHDLRTAYPFRWIATYALDGSDRIMVLSDRYDDVAITVGMCFFVNADKAFTIELDGSDWGMSVAQAPSVQRKGTLATSWGAMKRRD